MKILLITACLPFPPDKGEKIRTLAILEALSSIATIDLIAITREQSLLNSKKELEKFCQSIRTFHVSKLDFLFKLPLALIYNRSLTHAFFYSASARKQIESIDFKNYDAVFVISGNVYLNLKLPFAIPVYWDFIDLDSNKWLKFAKKETNALMRLVYQREASLIAEAEKAIATNVKSAYVINQNELLNAKANGNSITAKILPLTLPESYIVKENINKNAKLVVFSGQLDYQPNIDAIYYLYNEIYPIIRKQIEGIKFLMIGRNPSQKLIEHCREFDFTGEVVNSQELISKAAVYVIPLQEIIGMPTKVLEALASGIPIVASSQLAAIFGLEHNLNILIADSALEFAEKIGAVLLNQELADRLSTNAKQISMEHFSSDKIKNYLKAEFEI